MLLPQGTRIKINSNESAAIANLVGNIVGYATQDQPVIGVSYIIQPVYFDALHRRVISEDYPYSHFCAFRCQFDVIG